MAMSQGVHTSFQMLKKIVMEFASNADGGKAMQIGSFERTNQERYDYEKGAWLHVEASGRGMTEGGGDGDACYALGKGGSQCYNCNGFGHFTRQCLQKGKGTGKGKDANGLVKIGGKNGAWNMIGKSKGGELEGYGKGKKGPADGCWTCGGAHFQNDCPDKRREGQMSHLLSSGLQGDDWTQQAETDEIRRLSSVLTV